MEMQAGVAKHKTLSDKESLEVKNERDVFREIPLRYLGYANEVGESFRHTVPVRLVHLSYVLASGYVLAHAVAQGLRASRQAKAHASVVSKSPDPATHHTPTLVHSHSPFQSTVTPSLAVIDTLVWQGLASVVVPGLTINRLCAVSRVLLSRYAGHLLPQQARKWITVAVGLGSIPLIIHPIDWTVDRFMDYLIRPWLRKVAADTR